MARLSAIKMWTPPLWTHTPLRRWGWQGAAGLTMLLVAAVLALTWLPHLAQQNRRLSAAADEARQQARRDQQRIVTAQAVPNPAQRFTAAFPDAELREARLAALLTAAKSNGLSVQRGEFRMTREPTLGLLKYSVNLPLSGSYVQLRALIEDMQNRDTAVALERLRLQRSSARATTVDADMTWSFYMRAPADGEAEFSPAATPTPTSAFTSAPTPPLPPPVTRPPAPSR